MLAADIAQSMQSEQEAWKALIDRVWIWFE